MPKNQPHIQKSLDVSGFFCINSYQSRYKYSDAHFSQTGIEKFFACFAIVCLVVENRRFGKNAKKNGRRITAGVYVELYSIWRYVYKGYIASKFRKQNLNNAGVINRPYISSS